MKWSDRFGQVRNSSSCNAKEFRVDLMGIVTLEDGGQHGKFCFWKACSGDGVKGNGVWTQLSFLINWTLGIREIKV